MNRRAALSLFSLGVGVVGLGLLVVLTPGATFPHPAQLLVFTGLSLVIKRAGFHTAAPATHSLVGIVDLAAILLFGPVPGGWIAATSEGAYLVLHALRRGLRSREDLVDTPFFNAGLKAIMALASGGLYGALGGRLAPTTLHVGDLLPLLALFFTWFAMDHLGWALREFVRGGLGGLKSFLRAVAVASLLVELLPLPTALVIAAVHAGMGLTYFGLLALALVATAYTVQRLAEIQQHMQVHVNELTILERLSQAVIRAQLDVGRLCDLLYEHIEKAVGCKNFVMELIEGEQDEGRVMVWVQEGQRHDPTTARPTGVLAWMRKTPEPIQVHDVTRERLPGPLHLDEDLRSLLVHPMLAGQRLVGSVLLWDREPRTFSHHDRRLVSLMTAQLAAAIENARLYQREWRRVVQLSTIGEVSRQVAAVTDLDHLFAHVVRLIKGSFGFDHVHIFTVDKDAQEAVFRASTSPMDGPWRERGLSLPLHGPGIVAWVAREGQPLLVPDVRAEPRYIVDPDGVLAGTRSELAVPMKVEDRVLGVLDVQSSRIGAFTRDDLFVLQTVADAIAIAIEDANLYQEAMARRHLEEELRVAQEIQTSLLPDCPPELPGWDIAVDWRPARQVAGDFYDFVYLPDGQLGVIIADVSDKGIPAALFMAMARSLIRAMVLSDRPPAQALRRASQLILADSRTDMFVTLFYAAFDPATGRVTYVNAGHNPPLLFRADPGSVAQLRADGVALGAVEDIELNTWELTLDAGDMIVMYTDGVTEAINSYYEPFGVERLVHLILEHHDLSPAGLIAKINQALAEFVGDEPIFDDAALVVLKRLGR